MQGMRKFLGDEISDLVIFVSELDVPYSVFSLSFYHWDCDLGSQQLHWHFMWAFLDFNSNEIKI